MALDNFHLSLFENVVNILPLKKVHSYEQGVKFRFGKDVDLKKAGIYFFIPFIEGYEIRSVVPEVINLPNQSLVTKDNINIAVSGAIEYEIYDLRKWWCGVQDFDQTLVNTALGYLSRSVRNTNFSDIRTDSKALENKVFEELKQKVEPWGTELLEFYLTDLVPCRAIRLLGNGEGTQYI